MLKSILSFLILLLIPMSIYAYGQKYLCKAFDEDAQSEYEWYISITPAQDENIFDLRGDALDNTWHYVGHGFRKDNHFYFYWKITDSDTSGLVHYTVEKNGKLLGDWIADDSKKILTESCAVMN